MNDSKQATWIKFFALLTAIPRWVGALLAAEGFAIPDAWLNVWVPTSALLAAGMAVTEAWAFSFVFTAWRNQTDKRARNLFVMAVTSAAIFVFVLAPYVKARVVGQDIAEVLSNPILAWAWAVAIAASTISIIITVGYAQREDKSRAKTSKAAASKSDKSAGVCWCGYEFKSHQSQSAHLKRHKNELKDTTSVPEALNLLADLYPGNSAKPADVRKLMTGKENEKIEKTV